MKYCFLILTLCSFLLSCKSAKNNTSAAPIKSNSIHLNLLKQDTGASELKNDSIINFQRNKIKKNLPQIKSLNYLFANTAFEKVFQKDKYFKDSLHQFLNFYHNKLPDIAKYQAYFVSLDCYDTTVPGFICPQSFAVLSLGFLVMYDPALKHAYVINIEYNYLVDAFSEDMNFAITKSNIIYLEETYLTDSDADESGSIYAIENLRAKHKIQITQQGKIIITEVKEE